MADGTGADGTGADGTGADGSREERAAEIARIYHSKIAFKNAAGQQIGPQGDAVVAGPDDRKDYYALDEKDPHEALQKRLVDSTVILTDKDDLLPQPDGSYVLKVAPFRQGRYPPCAGERFGNQHTGGWCSGFMVAEDMIVTAGHCGATDTAIRKTAYVFGFRVPRADHPGTTEFSAAQVYFGRELIAHNRSDTGDFAVIRVDRAITAPGAVALQVRSKGSLDLGQKIGVIGHPSGLPVKIAFGETTVVMSEEDPWFFANLDTYGGNSGSAVFNTDGQVEGILVRGAKDYDIDAGAKCFRSNKIENSEGSEAVTKASAFVKRIPKRP